MGGFCFKDFPIVGALELNYSGRREFERILKLFGPMVRWHAHPLRRFT